MPVVATRFALKDCEPEASGQTFDGCPILLWRPALGFTITAENRLVRQFGAPCPVTIETDSEMDFTLWQLIVSTVYGQPRAGWLEDPADACSAGPAVLRIEIVPTNPKTNDALEMARALGTALAGVIRSYEDPQPDA